MSRIRITGLVRIADDVRRSLAAPLTPHRKAALKRQVASSIARVDAILAAEGMSVGELPGPSRRAYAFLRSVDVDGCASVSTPGASAHPVSAIVVRGLKRSWEGILDQIAEPTDDTRVGEMYAKIIEIRDHVSRGLERNGFSVVSLKRPSREAYAWLQYFSVQANFDAYIAAVRQAHPILQAARPERPGVGSDLLIEYRQMAGLYRMRAYPEITRVTLATPMIAFDEPTVRALAAAMFGNGSKQPVIEAAHAEACQVIQAELDALGGADTQTAGVHHDLAVAYERVTQRYFNGDLARPRLTWNRILTGQKFGHYDPLADTVMLSCTLDQPDVPEFVVDFVMYHELLHKKHGAAWQNGRQAVHTPAFRAEERTFEQFAAAKAELKRLAGRYR